MQPSRFGPNLLSDGRCECDDIVFDLGLNVVKAEKIEVSLLADHGSRVLRHQSGFGENSRCCQLYVKPLTKLRFVVPDAPHLGAGITRDHAALLRSPSSSGVSRGTCNCKLP